jgi:hypothetical protein
LFEHVTVLVQHQRRVLKEIGRASSKIDTPPAGCSDRPPMQADEQGVLDDADLVDALTEQKL